MGKIRIVIIEDNIDYMTLLREYLSQDEAFDVVATAVDGVFAIEAITALEPDVVILDMIMPRLGGLGVLEKLKKHHFINKPQIIVISAINNFKVTQIAFSYGIDYFMVKPFDLEELSLIVKKLHQTKKSKKSPPAKSSAEEENGSLELRIKRLLDELGVPSHLNGYHFLLQAVTMVVKDPTVINALSKKVYAPIAAKFESTPERIERSMRNAIEITWSRGDFDIITNMFNMDYIGDKSKPSNLEFLILVSNKFWDTSKILK